MKNNLKSKSKLFAQYWGQKVMINGSSNFEVGYLDEPREKDYLELKHVSSITDEELVKIAKFYESTAHNVKLEDNQIEFDFIYGDQGASGAIEISDGYCMDWLRNNGFATEWMGLSVENIVNFGWIKLKEN